MAKPGRTQKQIAERYKGNLGYYHRLHPWRRTRLIVSLITVLGGLLAIFLFRDYGRETFFNAGKIATAHAKCANVCETGFRRRRSTASARCVISSTAFTKRTFSKIARVRHATRNIVELII